MGLKLVRAAALAALFVEGAAHASVVQYSDPGSWSSGVSGVSAVPVPTSNSYLGTGSAASVTYGGVTFSENDTFGPAAFFGTSSSLPQGIFGGFSSEIQNQVGTANILISFASPVYGFSLYYRDVTFNNYSPSNEVIGNVPTVNVSLSNGDALTVAGTYPNFDFTGISDTNSFTSVLLTTQGINRATNLTGLDIADISYAASPVPIPAAAWLMLSGLGGLGALARKKRTA